jgi:cytochrome c nitrite reductase small subunit
VRPAWARTTLFVGLGLAIGIPAGVGSYAFIYARGASYLSNDPRACINCHVMNDQYRSWSRSSHHQVATCNQCHVPQSLVSKYLVKAQHGLRHSIAFTTQKFEEPIRMRPSSRNIVENSCKNCHRPLLENSGSHSRWATESCIRCHSAAGHPG